MNKLLEFFWAEIFWILLVVIGLFLILLGIDSSGSLRFIGGVIAGIGIFRPLIK